MSAPVLDAELVSAIRDIRMLVFDFDGVFTDNGVWVFEDGREAVRCSRSDGLGLAKLKRKGIPMLILSTEKNPVVSARAKKLGLPCRQGCDDKAKAIAEIASEQGVSLRQVAFVGNDINDLECLRLVGLPIVVADAYPEVAGIARWRTQRTGGHGAVREICDTIDTLLS